MKWECVAREELSTNPTRSDTKLVTGIIAKTGTDASRETVKAWWKANSATVRGTKLRN
jgi:hypothetical protein